MKASSSKMPATFSVNMALYPTDWS
jgi:hypothetical protein